MALEAVVFPQDPFTYGCNKDNYLYSLFGGGGSAASDEGSWSHDYYGGSQTAQEKALLGIVNNNNIDNNNNNHNNNYNNNNLHANWDCSSPSVLQNVKDQWDSHSHSHSSPETTCTTVNPPPSSATTGRRKRRRTKRAKNEEEIENQRMTHIAVERNRRKQMNEYLAVLRSLMPPSFVQRGDQASIIGGAINFVKELEQLLQCMKGQKNMKEQKQEAQENNNGSSPPPPFAEFFMFPQYSTRATQGGTCYPSGTSEEATTMMAQNGQNLQSRAVADIEVSLVDGHANIKILVKKRHGQLARMVVGLQSLGFSILHLNVTTVDDMVLATVSVKVEEGCEMNTVDEIAAAVNQLSRTVQEEDAAFS